MTDQEKAARSPDLYGVDMIEREVPPHVFADPAAVACYKWALATTAAAWGRMDDYSLRYSGLLANLCDEGMGGGKGKDKGKGKGKDKSKSKGKGKGKSKSMARAAIEYGIMVATAATKASTRTTTAKVVVA
jgi:hypothetical protein